MTADVIFSRQRHVGIITLSRPQALNALTLEMIQSMQQQLIDWRQDDTVHAVVLQSVPGKAFCAGGDVRWLYDAGKSNNPQQMQFFWHEYRLNHYIHHFGKPFVALMDGITMGGGVGIGLHGSHPIASENFTFAMPETGIGFFPDIGASYLLARCPDQTGIYLGLTGNRLNAAEAKYCRLINQVVPANQFPDLLSSIVAADLSKDAFEAIDRCVRDYADTQQNAVTMEHLDIINDCFAQSSVEAILTALDNSNDWGIGIAQALRNKAPLSLKVTLEQIRKAKNLSMADCIKMDYCLVSHFMRDKDFYEGVRALLVDKDKNPKWQPDNLQQITDGRVADYFECDQKELELII